MTHTTSLIFYNVRDILAAESPFPKAFEPCCLYAGLEFYFSVSSAQPFTYRFRLIFSSLHLHGVVLMVITLFAKKMAPGSLMLLISEG